MMIEKIIKIIPEKYRNRIGDDESILKIVKNINWLTLGVIFRDVLGLFLVAWIARYLGPKQFGIMNYAISFVALFATLSTLGLDNIVVRNILKRNEFKKEYMGTAFFLKLGGSFLLLITSVFVISLMSLDDISIKMFVLIISFSYLFKSLDVIDYWFQSKIESKYTVFAKTISFILISILRIIFILINSSLVSFIIAFSLDFIITSFFLIYYYSKNENIFLWKFNYKIAIEFLSDSWPLILSGAAVMVYMKIDQVLIGNLIGEEQLGIYASAAKLSEAWYFIPTVVMSSVFPAILNAKKKSKELYLKRMQILFDFFVIFTFLVALIVSLLSPIIIKILYGEEYLEAARILSIHIWAGIPVFGGVIVGKYLISENLTKVSLYMTLFGAIANVVLNLLLIPKFGIIGAAYTTLISYTIATYSILFNKKTSKIGMQMLKSFNIFRYIEIFHNK